MASIWWKEHVNSADITEVGIYIGQFLTGAYVIMCLCVTMVVVYSVSWLWWHITMFKTSWNKMILGIIPLWPFPYILYKMYSYIMNRVYILSVVISLNYWLNNLISTCPVLIRIICNLWQLLSGRFLGQ